MRITVLGTGIVGRTLAGRLDQLGHEVTIGTRDPERTRAGEDFASWSADVPSVGLEAFGDVPESALFLNATNGAGSLEALAAVGDDRLDGRVLVDVSNPLDFSEGFPPRLLVVDTDSMAEQIQRAHPGARVVKTLNTMNASVMADPGRLPEPTTVFVSGDDTDAKATVSELLTSLGHTDVLDLGALETARGAEMYVALWIRTWQSLGTLDFNLKIVR
ncbi:NADPH-dependent F420 reductase [Nocardioides bigeumensis]|uniref:NAD(P)-binding domain-containing protein n=1 Tax=Nocardioides bigeumensis TaxID=433657 RepID=A0ABP5K3D6_9ACTN